MYAAQQKIGISVRIIKMVFEGLNNCKTIVFQRKMTSAIHWNIVKLNWPYDNPVFVLKIGQLMI